VSPYGDVVGNPELYRITPDYVENQRVAQVRGFKKRNPTFADFLGTRKPDTSKKANDLIGSTPKPDKITAGQWGSNLEPTKSPLSGHCGLIRHDEPARIVGDQLKKATIKPCVTAN
jgi:hypothetical protein